MREEKKFGWWGECSGDHDLFGGCSVIDELRATRSAEGIAAWKAKRLETMTTLELKYDADRQRWYAGKRAA